MDMEIAGCPFGVSTRNFDGPDTYAATLSLNDIPVRDSQKVSEGIPLAASGTVRDEYPQDDGDVYERIDRHDAQKLRAIQAARKAAGLPRRRTPNGGA
jgi:hypothetical protein